MHTSPTENAIEGTVEVTEPLGDEQIVDVSVGSEADGELELTVKVSNTTTSNAATTSDRRCTRDWSTGSTERPEAE